MRQCDISHVYLEKSIFVQNMCDRLFRCKPSAGGVAMSAVHVQTSSSTLLLNMSQITAWRSSQITITGHHWSSELVWRKCPCSYSLCLAGGALCPLRVFITWCGPGRQNKYEWFRSFSDWLQALVMLLFSCLQLIQVKTSNNNQIVTTTTGKGEMILTCLEEQVQLVKPDSAAHPIRTSSVVHIATSRTYFLV